MHFCPQCGNEYDITKNSGGDREVQRMPPVQDGKGDILDGGAVDYKGVIQKLINGDEITEQVDLKSVLKSDEYKRLDNEAKEYVFNKIQDKLPNDQKQLLETVKEVTEPKKMYFFCYNCSTGSEINPGTTIFTRTSDTVTQFYSSEKYKNMLHSDILPITRQYICKNDKCVSHKDIGKREAVMFRPNNTYIVKYICKACETVQ